MSRPKPIGFSKEKASRVLEENGVDVLIASSPENVFYTCGLAVRAVENNPILFALANQYPTIVAVYKDGSESMVTWALYNATLSWVEEAQGIMNPEGAMDAIASFIKKHGFERGVMGIESLMPYYQYEKLKKTFPDAQFRVSDDLFLDMRLSKSEEEIRRIKESTRIADRTIEVLVENIAEGISDFDFLKIAKKTIIDEGAAGADHVTLSVGNSDPEAPGTGVKMKRGNITRFDIGAIYRGYNSDVSRHGFLGEVPSDIQEPFDAAVEVQKACVKAIKPGAHPKKVNQTALEAWQAHGRKDPVFITIHSVGLQTEEFHWLDVMKGASDRKFVENAVMDIEAWSLHSSGMLIGNEDTYLVTSSGCERISRLDMKIFTVQ
ncbi:MAG: M24 family metallopeptidase [Candidatus Jordarchaeum sp.]|uniref:M24 family metallopeptidase n=1 Tax=Candidatus Jordarchaeum sp. TaxID=2823881 RepID=UPI004049547F